VETHSVLGTLWAGLGMGAYFTAVIWINALLALFLTPLVLIPSSYLLDGVIARRSRKNSQS